MIVAAPFVAQVITDDDIAWACGVLKLPANAFSGPDGRDPRLSILKSGQSLDVEACPGSGKTTLLVAKLAILARNWNEQRRGICVLSHTNVARREIERCLGSTAEGRKLLSYPHYVGTIHGFFNQFLATPWLRSLGYPASVFDDRQCEQHRRRLLALAQYTALRNYVTPREATPRVRVVAAWHVASPDFLIVKDDDQPEFVDQGGVAARQLTSLAKTCAQDGYHRYEEVFMWSHDLLDKQPEVATIVRQRFPMLFIDEVQDNNESQSALIHRVFVEGAGVGLRQRYGDSNQAIYGHQDEKGATSDVFPQDAIRRDVPNSHRFGQSVATLANPFGLVPHGLIGLGPPTHKVQTDTASQHAIFLFSDETVTRVLESYAVYLQETFTEQELANGLFTAVGAVHRGDAEDHAPRFVRHYWDQYDHELTASEPKPSTFFQYVAAGRKATAELGEAHQAVEKIAEGILRLVRTGARSARLSVRARKHRQIVTELDRNAELRGRYISLVAALVDESVGLDVAKWEHEWRDVVVAVGEFLANTRFNAGDIAAFLIWPAPEISGEHVRRTRRSDNFFRYPSDDPKVQIRVGSIHSVKGETHTATLVLDTYFHDHHLQALKPWLLGQKVGKGREGVRLQARLKQHYVAMTRPTHLLCLAMKDTFSQVETVTLKQRGWRVARIGDDGIAWL